MSDRLVNCAEEDCIVKLEWVAGSEGEKGAGKDNRC